MTFIDFDICNLPATLPVLYFVTLTYFFRSNISKVNISKTVRDSARRQQMAFAHFIIQCREKLIPLVAPLDKNLVSSPASQAYIQRVFSVCGDLTARMHNGANIIPYVDNINGFS